MQIVPVVLKDINGSTKKMVHYNRHSRIRDMKNSDDYETMPDEQLMVLASRGEKNAFATIVRRHQQALVNFFRRMGVNNNEEDLVQDTFVKLFKFRERYKPSAKFRTFLYFVARRIYVDYVRRQNRERTGAKAFTNHLSVVATVSDASSDQKTRAVEALHTLSEEMRSVVVLNVYQGLRYHEIVEILEIPLGTVKTRMFHALRKLRKAMSHDVEKA